MYSITWDKHTWNDLQGLDSFVGKRIIKRILELEENPYSGDIKRLKGSADLRLRVGDYRIIFSVEKNKINILKIGHRKDIYKQ